MPRKEAFVSVVIPSKDNVPILVRCLETVTQTVRELPYEIVIVDNGSSEANRVRITQEIDRITQEAGSEIRYLYRPMSFNFSHMCNLGGQGGERKPALILK